MVNAPPPKRRNLDRTIYLILLAVFFAALGNYLLGERLFLRADGIVLKNRSVIAATALVRVTEVAVAPGQTVAAGDVLLRAESLDVLGRLAELSMQDAALAERQATLRSERGVVESRLPEAIDRLDTYRDRLAQILAYRRGVPTLRREAVETEVYASQAEVTTLRASLDGLSQEIEAVESARRHAEGAISKLRTHYAEGRHLAGVDGIVGGEVPAPGEVYLPGEPILVLLWGDPYVLAYLPKTYLFAIENGDRVRISSGQLTHLGRIEAILPVSQSIPDEFRTAFRLDESKQLARVRLDPAAPFPVQSTVRISSVSGVGATLRRGLARLFGRLGFDSAPIERAAARGEPQDGAVAARHSSVT
ncbi:hypothetical protein [uncultured Jannaschia sp.]|uniref:HlyD family secretion protein n=1 Tax=uncultured Jannaschia sp. TaxID=293347 RepID=UPI00262B172D|nr:hypothetical protein [uncultured Jannaschia sp.]